MSGKRARRGPRATFENTVSKILEEGHVKIMTVDDNERGMKRP